MNCPDCGGACWDNRATKRNPKGPDYKCKACGKGIWERANGQSTQAPGNGVSALRAEAQSKPPLTWNDLATTYKRCAVIAVKTLSEAKVALEPSAVVASTATLFIQAMQAGLMVRPPVAAPPPPPMEPADDFDEAPYR